MASVQINELQLFEPKSWAGLTTENHLGTLFSEQPHLMSTIMSRVFGLNQYVDIDYFLSLGMEEELPDDRDFEWYLKGDDEKAVSIVGYSAVDSTRPGYNGTMINITMSEKYFSYTDKLIFDDRNYSVRVMAEPYSDGSNWIYPCQVMGGSDTAFIPPALLATGKQLSKLYSPQEGTLNKTYGDVTYTSPFKMRNCFSTFSKKYVIPANMHNRVLAFPLLDPKSNKTTMVWTQYAEWEFLCQWYKEKNNNLWFSNYNRRSDGTFAMKGASGFPIKEGAGIREQISPAYKFNYTKFGIDYLTDVLLNLSINILPEDKRHFIAFTGERGMVQFHKALENKTTMFSPTVPSAYGYAAGLKRIGGEGQNLSFGGQFREYMGPQGIKFSLVHNPLYDNVVHNRTLHPDGGPTESYRYTILNFGTTEGKNNIVRVYPKGEKEKMWHVPGSTSPLGPFTSFKSASASSVDGYELFCLAKQSAMIRNPMSCAELIYAGN